jgi:hypothetical protein
MKLYGKSELDKKAEELQQCREIVKQLIELGVNETQKLNIMRFLALTLENNEHLVEITTLIKSLSSELTLSTE